MIPSSPNGVSFGEAFRFWVKLGFISFGGPAGQIAIMHRELVERRRWISESRFLHALNYCMLLPGPEAQQLATYVGWLLHRTWGGIVAGTFFVLPSVFVLMALSYVYAAYGDVAAVAGILSGFKPVVVSIVVEAVHRIGKRALTGRAHVVIAALSFVAIYVLRVPFPLIVLGAAIAGLLARFPTRSGAAESEEEEAGEHAMPSKARLAGILAAGLALWSVPFLLLRLLRGEGSLHAELYLFFTKAAFVTFGGAYAVLAYVAQAAAGSYGWLTHAETVDGLALAETTPGPLIMVLQFVGFMAAWHRPEGLPPELSAVLGALVTTWATFLPCFLFIFLGAPYIEVLRQNRALKNVLSAVTAAVVGVILNLALVFGVAVVKDAFSFVLTLVSFFVLVRHRIDVLWVVLGGGLVGLVRALVMGGTS
jgi:chromate transporter